MTKNKNKITVRKLRLTRETLSRLNLERVVGGALPSENNMICSKQANCTSGRIGC